MMVIGSGRAKKAASVFFVAVLEANSGMMGFLSSGEEPARSDLDEPLVRAGVANSSRLTIEVLKAPVDEREPPELAAPPDLERLSFVDGRVLLAEGVKFSSSSNLSHPGESVGRVRLGMRKRLARDQGSSWDLASRPAPRRGPC